MTRVLVLVTGGTATMTGEAGLDVSAAGVEVLRDAAARWAAQHGAEVELDLDQPMRDSAEMTPDDWERWRVRLRAAAGEVDGFVLVHGTDTMAYTAAALGYALGDLDRPVVLTGAARSAGDPGTDAPQNLCGALDQAVGARPGVRLAFAGRVLQAATVWKRSTTDLDAFAGVEGTSRCHPAAVGLERFGGYDARRVVEVVTVTLGRWHDPLDWARRPDAVVLRVLGSGTAPGDPLALERLAALRAAGVPVLAVSQAPGAMVDLGRYAAGRGLVDAGVLASGGITAEAAYAKLHHVLGCGLEGDDLRQAVASDLVGESRGTASRDR